MIPCMGVDVLHEKFTADFDTGLLYWKDGRAAGRPQKSHGYVTVWTTHDGRRIGLLVHRVLWAMKYGAWPIITLDHADTIRSNNKLSNLRLATYAQNNVNRGPIRNGLKGATFDKRTGRYMAQINILGKNKFLGRYKTEVEAHDAYVSAAMKIYGEFCRSC